MDAKVPKHHLVKEQIAALIADAPPGTPLPTERDLASRFHTSRTTVRQALAALSVTGGLERTQGRGTFVAQPRRVLVRQLTSYSDDLRAQGSTASSELLSVGPAPADARTAQHLAIPLGTSVQRIERIRGVDGESLAHEIAQLVGELPGLRAELERRGSLYQTLREAYGVEITRVEDVVETVLAGPEEAARLGIDVGLPMLLIHRTGWDSADRPVEYTRSVFRGDRFSFIASSTGPHVPPAD